MQINTISVLHLVAATVPASKELTFLAQMLVCLTSSTRQPLHNPVTTYPLTHLCIHPPTTNLSIHHPHSHPLIPWPIQASIHSPIQLSICPSIYPFIHLSTLQYFLGQLPRFVIQYHISVWLKGHMFGKCQSLHHLCLWYPRLTKLGTSSRPRNRLMCSCLFHLYSQSQPNALTFTSRT